MKNILLLNSTVDHAFGFFRSFENLSGYRVFWADSVTFAPAKAARCCEKVFRVPPVKKEKEYINEIKKIIIENRIDLLFPIGEYETKAVSRNSGTLIETGVVIPIADAGDIELATDKLRLQEHCLRLDVPYAKTLLLETGIPAGLQEMSLPIIVKQRSGTGQKGLRIIRTEYEKQLFIDTYNMDSENDSYIIQEYIPGYDHQTMYSVGMLFNHGKLITTVPLKKIRAQKFTGGTCTSSCAVNDPELIDIAEKIGRSFPRWNGIMDVEIKKDPRNGKYLLIEINPRPWGCMFGAMTAGVDFPRLWLNCAENNPGECTDDTVSFSVGDSSAFLARDFLLFMELLREILFGRLKAQALSVLKTFKYPYLTKTGSGYKKTSDFVLHDIKPFMVNLLRQVYSK